MPCPEQAGCLGEISTPKYCESVATLPKPCMLHFSISRIIRLTIMKVKYTSFNICSVVPYVQCISGNALDYSRLDIISANTLENVALCLITLLSATPNLNRKYNH